MPRPYKKYAIHEPVCILEMHKKTARKFSRLHLDILIHHKTSAKNQPQIAEQLSVHVSVVNKVLRYYHNHGLTMLLADISIQSLVRMLNKVTNEKCNIRVSDAGDVTSLTIKRAAHICKMLSKGAYLRGRRTMVYKGINQPLDCHAVLYAAKKGDPRWRLYLHRKLGLAYEEKQLEKIAA